MRVFLLVVLLTLIACSGEEEMMNISEKGPMVSIENNGPNPCFPQLIAIITPESPDIPIISTTWSGPDDFKSEEVIIEATVPGTYTIEVIDQNNQSTTATITVTVEDFMSEPPTVVIEDQGLNEELALMLVAKATQSNSDIVSFTWSTTATTESILVTDVGSYAVTVIDDCGITAMTTIEISAKDLSPYEGVWKAVSADAAITTTVNGISTMASAKAIVLDYTLNFDLPNWSTMGNYTFEILIDNQTILSEAKSVMGSGTFSIEDNKTLTIDASFFEIDDMMTTSGSQTAEVSINEQGQMEVKQTQIQDLSSNNSTVLSEVTSVSVWNRE